MKQVVYKDKDDPEVKQLLDRLGLSEDEQKRTYEALELANEILGKVFGGLASNKHDGSVVKGAFLTVTQTLFMKTCEMSERFEPDKTMKEHIMTLLLNPIREHGYLISLTAINGDEDAN